MSLITECKESARSEQDMGQLLESLYIYTANLEENEFVQVSAHGSVREHDVRNRIDGALVLGRLEPVCHSIETLLGRELDFTQVNDSCGTTTFDCSVIDRQQILSADISFSTGLRRNIEANWSNSTEICLDWKSLHLRLKLDKFAIGLEDESRLGIGSLMLLPSSYNSSWFCEAFDHSGRLEQICRLDKETGELTLSEVNEKPLQPVDNCPETKVVGIVMTGDFLVNPTHLFERDKKTKPTLDGCDGGESILQNIQGLQVECYVADELAYGGSLARMGDGFCVHLEEKV